MLPSPVRRFRHLVGLVVLVAVAAWVVIWVLDLPGRTDQGVKGGIVGLELIGSAAGADRLVGDGEGGMSASELAAVSSALRWDFLLILIYTVVFLAAAQLLVPLFRLRAVRTSTGPAMALAAVPGLLDVIENVLLLVALHASQSHDVWYLGAATFAVTKFAVLAGLVPLVVAAVASGLATPNWLYALLDEPEPRVQSVPPSMERRHGLALSGGGVRAATLTLGTLQELERDSDLGWQGAAVTGVSGGAYMAGAWLLGRDGPDGTADAWAMVADGRRPGPEERHLLDNLGYLTATWPRGRPQDPGTSKAITEAATTGPPARARHRPAVWATVFTGLLVNIAVIAAVLVVIVTPVAVALRALADLDGCAEKVGAELPLCLVAQPRVWWPPVGWVVAGLVLAFVWVVVGKLPIRSGRGVMLVLKSVTLGSLALGACLTLLLVVLPLLIALVYSLSWALVAAAAGALVGVIGSVVRIVRRFAAVLAPKVGGVAFALLLALACGALATLAWSHGHEVQGLVSAADWLAWLWHHRALLVALAVVLVIWAAASPELWSLNALYRGKLRSAYALHRRGDRAVPYVNDRDGDGGDLVPEPDLTRLAAAAPTDPGAPERGSLTLCASAHATTKGVRTHYGIPAMSFTFDPDHVRMHIPSDDQGAFTTYACTTADFQRAYQGAGLFTTKRITTMFAVALAGAAVAPAMGRYRIGPTSALLTFANVRLGGWLPNPRYVEGARQRRFPIVRLGYLLKEFLGIHDPTDPFVYVSDGGHWENSGLVELLRGHMPREVVMVDADSGPAASLRQLTQAIDLAKLECDVDVLIDLDPLRGFAEQAGAPVFAERAVTLGVLRQGSRWGLLWYTKPILTRTTPTPLLAHREVAADFPATSTVDQFFDTSTYVAYRDLGRHNSAEVKRARAELTRILAAPVQAGLPDPVLPVDAGWVGQAFVDLLDQLRDEDRTELLRRTRIILGILDEVAP